MIPILYSKHETDFESNGIGFLRDAISCEATEERNGADEVILTYPISGAFYEYILEGSIIKVKPSETRTLQLYRIYKSSKPIGGTVTFSARHISYDLSGIPLPPIEIDAESAQDAINKGFAASLLPHTFTAWSDIESSLPVSITKPRSLRNFLGGAQGSILDRYGGEFEFDNFTVKLYRARGTDSGVVLRYGKNITDAKQEKNIEECFTHIYPYAVFTKEDGSETVVTLPEKLIELINSEELRPKTHIADLTQYFSEGEEITENALREKAESYIKSHDLSAPKINITVSFEALWQTPEYKEFAPLERINLCDTVSVYIEKLGITARAKVIKTVYDVLAEKYKKIELGSPKPSLINSVTELGSSVQSTKQEIESAKKETSTAIQNAILNATNAITGQSGGYVVLNPPKNPQEILILDKPTIAEALNVWRWNSAGLGHSANGYNGPYSTAITQDGKIVADFILTGVLRSIELEACTIKGSRIYAVDNGEIGGYAETTVDGFAIYNRYGSQLVKIGYPTEESNYPFILLRSNEDNGVSGICKRFDDGLWVGNDAPAEAYGTFAAKAGYQGIFVSFADGKTYVVSGEEMQNVYTGEAIARFG